MTNKLLSLLGMARRAGRLSLGHDASIACIVGNRAKLCLCTADASKRLQKEMQHACSFEGKMVDFLILNYDSSQIGQAIGKKVSVLCIDDDGFAAKVKELAKED